MTLPQRPDTATSPVPIVQQQAPPALPTQLPAQSPTQLPPRPGSLPPAPTLPQRPAVSAPPVNSFQMQQIHLGQVPVPPAAQSAAPDNGVAKSTTTATPSTQVATGDVNIDESKPTPTSTDKACAEEKQQKKEKTKATRLVYSESELSPEEKMARLPRYAFVPQNKVQAVH